jgi:hypothetical protein
MSDKVAEIKALAGRDNVAAWVGNLWDTYNNQRAAWLEEKIELQKYLFATDTTTTTNSALPWKNSTTLPKLTQIRDNLHSNYLSALFPNDKWLQWKGYTKKDSSRRKAKVITAYMENKTRESRFRQEVSRLLYDYIDWGNAFVIPSYERRYNIKADGSKIPGYIGPRGHRISPHDIVFNPLASTFEDTFKIIRSLKTIGELKKLASISPEHKFWEEAINKRLELQRSLGGYSKEDFDKSIGFSVDGFGSMYEYIMSDYMEILEFYGDYHNAVDGVLEVNKMITVVDRSITVRNVNIPTLDGRAPIRHVGWRLRPDNLWAMGPLDNLVGMQYRIDHLENLKADAMDLIIHPPLKIIGEVEEFVWGPGVEIHLDENGDIQEVSKNMTAILGADNSIQELEDKMELYAGAPREAMGVRSPGEKTAFEVQKLDSAAGRIFQEKITAFEVNLLEPHLNDQLEIAIRNFDGSDIVRTTDNALGITEFATITTDDLSSSGVIRPVGARHFAEAANELQNLIGIANSPLWAVVAPHTSSIALTKFIEDVTAISGYEIFRPNVAIQEQKESQALMSQAGEDLEMEASAPVNPNRMPAETVA